MNYSLSSEQLFELKRCHKLSKKRTEADRIKAVYLLGSGWELLKVCEALLLTDDTIRSYFNNYEKNGLKGLIKNKYLGRSSQLTSSEKEQLISHLEEHTFTKVTDIINYVEKEFDVLYSESGMRQVLSSLGFVYKKPEKIPYRVDQAAQRHFIKKYKKIKSSLDSDDGVYFMDATHPEHTPVPAHGWIKKGVKKVVKSNPRPYRLNINGAINIDSLDMVIRFEDKINKETIKDFLESLRKHQPTGWIHLICDNAGYNQSPEVQELAKSMAIKIHYLPPYSPNLNLIERMWKFYKKKVLYNTHYQTLEGMIMASKKFFTEIGAYRDELRSLMSEKFQKIPI